jgi:hypothetical protein
MTQVLGLPDVASRPPASGHPCGRFGLSAADPRFGSIAACRFRENAKGTLRSFGEGLSMIEN